MYRLKSIVFCVLSLFVRLPALAQDPQTAGQAMLSQLRNAPEDTTKILTLCEYAWKVRSSAPGESLEYAQKANKLARNINFTKGIIKSLSFMGIAMRNLGNYGIAGKYLQESLLLANKHNYLEEEGFGNINIGNILYLERKYEEALIHIHRASPIAQKTNNKSMQAYIWVNLGRIYHKLGKENQAFDAFEKAITLRKELKDTLGIATVEYELAESYLTQKDYTKTHKLLQSVEALAQKYEDKSMYAGTQNIEAKMYLQQKDFQKAKKYAEKSLKIAAQINDKTRISLAYQTLAEIEAALNNFEKAHQYLQKHITYQDSLHQETLRTRADQWAFGYELQRKDAEINREMAEIQRRDFWMLVLGSVLILLLVVGTFGYFRYAQHKKQHQQIRTINLDLEEANNKAENYNHELTQLNENLHNSLMALRASEDEQKRLNQILTDKNNSLQEINHEKDSLMGIVAHDLKAPLNRIRGILELFTLTSDLNDDQKHLVKMGHDIIQNGSNLIRDLLDISYYEHGGTKLRLEMLNWQTFLKEHHETFAQDAQKKNIQLHLTLPALPIQSITDEDCVSRIVSNLLSNAIKFSPKDKNIYLTLATEADKIVISIQDEGQGFTEEDRHKLFHKFEKLSAKPTGGEASTGLGLSIIKVLTEKLQGTITLESEAGKGAKFVLTFPIKS